MDRLYQVFVLLSLISFWTRGHNLYKIGKASSITCNKCSIMTDVKEIKSFCSVGSASVKVITETEVPGSSCQI